MERDQLLQHFLNTLSPDNNLRSGSERYLLTSIGNPGFMSQSLEIGIDQTIPQHIRLVAITFVKNKIKRSWFVNENSPHALLPELIQRSEKNSIKSKLVPALLQSIDNKNITQQLTNSIELVLRSENNWDVELMELSYNLLSQHGDKFDHVYTSLMVLYQISRYHRFDLENRSFIDSLMEKFFPILENLLQSYIQQVPSNPQVGSMIYLVLKIFKYCTYTDISPYFLNNLELLSKWCAYQFQIIDLPNTSIADMDTVEKTHQPLVKCKKWSFANLHRIKSRHSNNSKNPQLSQSITQHFIPSILQHYWTVIGKWSQSKDENWLSEVCLYHLIAFISECLQVDSIWPSIQSQLEPVLKHVMIPMLSASEETVELFEDDPQEYLRKFYDLNRDSKTADVAANEFIYTLGHKRFDESIFIIVQLLNEIFSKRQQDSNSLSNAYEAEAGLRILGNIWLKLGKDSSPLKNQLDDVSKSFILPQLTDGKFKWLQTRTCETIALTSHNYQDMQLLSTTYETVSNCFDKENPLPLRIEAADALRYLVSFDPISKAISPNISMIMGELLELSNSYEFELINEIMEDLVTKFSKDLEPYAMQLASNLNTQFLRIAEELLALQNGNADGKVSNEETDKEYQAASILSTLNTMVVTMTSQKEITFNLLKTFEPSVRFVLENGIAIFLTEIMDLLETTNYTLKAMIPESWSLFQIVLESFQMYGFDYFDNYLPYFETVCIYGFKDCNISEDYNFQQFLPAILNLLETDDLNADVELIEFVYKLIHLVVLSVGQNIHPILHQIMKPIMKITLECQSDIDLVEVFNDTLKPFLKIFISGCYVQPALLNQIVGDDNFMKFIEMWFNNSDNFLKTVFDLKLQILALISLLDSQLPVLNKFDNVILLKLVQCFEKLPAAIEKRVNLMKRDINGPPASFYDDDDDDEGNEYLEEDDDEMDQLVKDTPIDQVNVIAEFKMFFTKEQAKLANYIPPEKQQFIHDLINK